jgi:hypothetical protein
MLGSLIGSIFSSGAANASEYDNSTAEDPSTAGNDPGSDAGADEGGDFGDGGGDFDMGGDF